jgi:hypothetical protein
MGSSTGTEGPDRAWTRQACCLVAAAVVGLVLLLLGIFAFMFWAAG